MRRLNNKRVEQQHQNNEKSQTKGTHKSYPSTLGMGTQLYTVCCHSALWCVRYVQLVVRWQAAPSSCLGHCLPPPDSENSAENLAENSGRVNRGHAHSALYKKTQSREGKQLTAGFRAVSLKDVSCVSRPRTAVCYLDLRCFDL